MFAVVRTGGKQYRMTPDQELRIEKIDGDAGTIVQLSEVLVAGDSIGAPLVSGASVAVEIIEQARARKVIAFKKRRRQNSRRKRGHRQHYTLVRVSEILTDGAKPSKGPSGRAKPAKDDDAEDASVAETVTDTIEAGASAVSDAVSTAVEAASEAAEDAATFATGSAATKEADGPLFQAPEGEPDKLTKIKGIGPVAERQLNEQGITTYRQIAELSDDEIQKVDDYMPFSSAQIRDWQGQARDLIK